MTVTAWASGMTRWETSCLHPKYSVMGGGRLDNETLLQELPALLQCLWWACHLEVVDMDDQEQLQFGMVVARWPPINGNKPYRLGVRIALFLPEGTTVRVTVQGLLQRTYGLSHTAPRCGPLLLRK